MLIKNLYYQGIRPTRPSFIWSFNAVSKNSTCSFSKPKYILRDRKQEKIRPEFSQKIIVFNLRDHFERSLAQSPFPTKSA